MQVQRIRHNLATYYYAVAAGEIGFPHIDDDILSLRTLVRATRSPLRNDAPNLTGKFNTVI